MTATPQQMNALSELVREVRRLYDAAYAIKAVRPRCLALGAFELPDGAYPGELDHLSEAKLAALQTAMDALDAAFVTPATKDDPRTSPAAAMIAVIR